MIGRVKDKNEERPIRIDKAIEKRSIEGNSEP